MSARENRAIAKALALGQAALESVPEKHYLVNPKSGAGIPPLQLLPNGVYLLWTKTTPPPIRCYNYPLAPLGSKWVGGGSAQTPAKDRLELQNAEGEVLIQVYRYPLPEASYMCLAVDIKNLDESVFSNLVPIPVETPTMDVEGFFGDSDLGSLHEESTIPMEIADKIFEEFPGEKRGAFMINPTDSISELNHVREIGLFRDLFVTGRSLFLSDSSTKSNVERLTADPWLLEKFIGVGVFKFHNINGDQQIGFMADQLKVFFPELVERFGESGQGKDMVKLNDVVALQFMALQQLVEKVRILESKVVDGSNNTSSRFADYCEMASQKQFAFSRYLKIRTDGDYSAGVTQGKNAVCQVKLSCERSPIRRSILVLDETCNKLAMMVHKSILGYCGDLAMLYPEGLAHDILLQGRDKPSLIDEIYIQLMKHVTKNSRVNSLNRAWELMCIVVTYLRPSASFEVFCLNFFLSNSVEKSLAGSCARFCVHSLRSWSSKVPQRSVPSISDLAPFRKRPPILATIRLVDGGLLKEDFEVLPESNVSDVVERCVQALKMTDDRSRFFGVFVCTKDNREPLLATHGSHSPRPLRDSDYLGNVIVEAYRDSKQVSFTFKRKIFLNNTDSNSRDAVFVRLMYLQCRDEVVSGRWPVLSELRILTFAAIALAVHSSEMLHDDQGLVQAGLMSWIPFNWRKKKSTHLWARAVLDVYIPLPKGSRDELMKQYVALASTLPLYGVTIFPARITQASSHATEDEIGVDCKGVIVLSSDRTFVKHIPYEDILRYGASSSEFYIEVRGKVSNRISFETPNSRDIRDLVGDYRALLKPVVDFN